MPTAKCPGPLLQMPATEERLRWRGARANKKRSLSSVHSLSSELDSASPPEEAHYTRLFVFVHYPYYLTSESLHTRPPPPSPSPPSPVPEPPAPVEPSQLPKRPDHMSGSTKPHLRLSINISLGSASLTGTDTTEKSFNMSSARKDHA